MTEDTSDRRPTTTYETLAATVADRDAGAFVHVADRTDDDMRYLTRFRGPDRPYAFVFLPGGVDTAAETEPSSGTTQSSASGHTVLCAPALFDEQARREFPGDTVRTDAVGDPAGERAAAVLADAGVSGPVLVPAQIRHDAVARLEAAGYEVTASDATSRARRTKTDAEIERHRVVQRAAVRGLARAETVLARATVGDDDRLHWDGSPLTTERLRRQVNATLAAAGVDPSGNSVIGAGATAADLHYVGDDAVFAGETVLFDLSPRGPAGYYADVTRTFVVAAPGGWERRAYVACEAAREAALEELAAGAGVAASTVHEEAAAELAAHGFRIDSSEVGFTHSTGHGVGLSLHEAPSLADAEPLAAGDVVTVEPGVYDPDHGGVRIEDLVVVREDGYELLQPYPLGSTPQDRSEAS